jgi:hypothetical protein
MAGNRQADFSGGQGILFKDQASCAARSCLAGHCISSFPIARRHRRTFHAVYGLGARSFPDPQMRSK